MGISEILVILIFLGLATVAVLLFVAGVWHLIKLFRKK